MVHEFLTYVAVAAPTWLVGFTALLAATTSGAARLRWRRVFAASLVPALALVSLAWGPVRAVLHGPDAEPLIVSADRLLVMGGALALACWMLGTVWLAVGRHGQVGAAHHG